MLIKYFQILCTKGKGLGNNGNLNQGIFKFHEYFSDINGKSRGLFEDLRELK